MSSILDDPDFKHHLVEAISEIEGRDIFRGTRHLSAAIKDLEAFTDEEDKSIKDLMNVLGKGGIFSSDISDVLDKSFKEIGKFHTLLAKLHTASNAEEQEIALDDLQEVAHDVLGRRLDLVELLHKEYERAYHLARELKAFLNAAKAEEFVSTFHGRFGKRKFPFFDGEPEHIANAINTSIQYARDLFDLLATVLLERHKRTMELYTKSLDRYSNLNEGSADERKRNYERLFETEKDFFHRATQEHHDALKATREAMTQLRETHKMFRKESRELRHLYGLISLLLKRIEKQKIQAEE